MNDLVSFDLSNQCQNKSIGKESISAIIIDIKLS